MPTEIQPELYPDVISLINETYDDQVEKIVSAQVNDDDAIVAIALDEDRIIGFKYTADDKVAMKLLNPEIFDMPEAPTIEGLDDPLADFDLPTLDELDIREDDRYAGIDFKPPATVRAAFRRAVRMLDNEQINPGDGLEPATIRWARKLATGEVVSPEKARMGYRFFKRNARFRDEPKDSAAWASWALWGYDEGRDWFNKLWKQMESADRADSLEAQKKSPLN